jgi:voltage-gated potassium channel
MMIDDLRGASRVVLFGYGKFGPSIARTLRKYETEVLVVEEDPGRLAAAQEEGLRTLLLDLTDDHRLEELEVAREDHLICVMDDDHLNVFLVLSLRGIYPENRIFAISDSIYATSKLKMAGANKVIDLYDISANRIHNILNKPIATRFLEGFTDESHEYSFREITIPEGSFLHGRMLGEIDFRRYGVIFIGMIDVELGNSFIFVTTGLDHKIDSGDIIVCIGHDGDLDRFTEAIGQREEPR